jgi:hypothetical protein
MSRFFLGAVLLGLAAAGFWLWLGDSGQESGGDATPAAVDQRAHPVAEMRPSRAATSIEAVPAREAPAPAAPVAAQAAALPASDPFRSFLLARRAASAPMPSVPQNQAEIRDAFKAALEESERRRAAARASPFGDRQ